MKERGKKKGKQISLRTLILTSIFVCGFIHLRCTAFSLRSLQTSLSWKVQRLEDDLRSFGRDFLTRGADYVDDYGETELPIFDELMQGLLKDSGASGAQLAVARGSELKFFEAYGMADRDRKERMTRRHVMRIANISKVITATAILKLIQDGHLSLDDRPFILLDSLLTPTGFITFQADPRYQNITIQHLLQDTAGWNVSASGMEPVFIPGALEVSQAMGRLPPLSSWDILRYVKTLPLDFDPGSAMEYSTIGYNVLGRVIEWITGMLYEDYIQENVLNPLGITSFRLGETERSKLAPNEAHYYGKNGSISYCLSIYPGQGHVQCEYGFGDLKGSANSFGGWIGNAKDLVRFTLNIVGTKEPALLSPELLNVMFRAPMPNLDSNITCHRKEPHLHRPQGLVWFLDLDSDGQVKSFHHTGSFTGSHALVLRLVKEQITIAYILNSLPANLKEFVLEVMSIFSQVAKDIKEWPTYDLFDPYWR